MLRRYNWAKELVDAGYAAIAPDALKYLNWQYASSS